MLLPGWLMKDCIIKSILFLAGYVQKSYLGNNIFSMQRFVSTGCQLVKIIFFMKKYLSLLATAFIFIFLPVLFSGCLKDTCRQSKTYSWFEPLYKTSAEVRANIKSSPAREIQ